MPHGNNPHRLPLDAIEEAGGGNYELTVGQLGKFRDYPPGLREFLKPSQGRLGPLSKTCRCGRIILIDIGKCREELGPGRRSKADFHKLVFRQKCVGVRKDRVKIKTLSGCDLSVPAHQEAKEL